MIKGKDIAFVGFTSESVGEFWYELHLEATEAPPIQLPEMLCPLGKHCVSSSLLR